MIKHTSLTAKMLLVTIIVGITTWSFLDPLQTRTIKQTFYSQAAENLSEDAHESRLLFDRYIQSFHQNINIFISRKQFYDYVSEKAETEWSTSPGQINQIKYLNELPPWLPRPSILRSFSHFHYAFLIDNRGLIREVYSGLPGPPPQALIQPTYLMLQTSHQQNLLTTIEGVPYLIGSETLNDTEGRPLASFMLATPLDEEFLIESQGTEHIVALAKGSPATILKSNRPVMLPSGTLLDSLREEYLFEAKGFLDYGSSDLHMELVTLTPKNQYRSLSESILSKERRNRIITTLLLILSFSLIMVWITGRIQELTVRVEGFTHELLDTPRKDSREGDEIRVLDQRFQDLVEEIDVSHTAMQRQSESLKESEKRYRTFVRDFMGIAHRSTIDLLPIFFHGAIEAITGYTEKEFTVGTVRWREIIHPDDVKDVSVSAEKVLSIPNHSIEREYRIIRKNKKIEWVKELIRNISDGTGKPAYVEGVIYVITKRKEAEQALLEIEERERRRIGNDLHDGLGQLLTGIAFKTRGLGRKLEKTSHENIEDAAEISILVDEAKKQVSHLARGLSPVNIQKGGFLEALDNLASYTTHMFGVRCDFVCEQPFSFYNDKVATQLYRIAQEAVTNAVKHGSPDRIKIALKHQNGSISLTVKDNGTGMHDISKNTGGMGLKIMGHRASMINASLEILKNTEGGTDVSCTIANTSLS